MTVLSRTAGGPADVSNDRELVNGDKTGKETVPDRSAHHRSLMLGVLWGGSSENFRRDDSVPGRTALRKSAWIISRVVGLVLIASLTVGYEMLVIPLS